MSQLQCRESRYTTPLSLFRVLFGGGFLSLDLRSCCTVSLDDREWGVGYARLAPKYPIPCVKARAQRRKLVITKIMPSLFFRRASHLFEVFQDTWRSKKENPSVYWNAALSCPLIIGPNYAYIYIYTYIYGAHLNLVGNV